MKRKTILLSIHPKFAELIFAGKKTVELRRSVVGASRGDRILIYASSPRSSVIGSIEVQSVTQTAPRKLWALVRDKCGISKSEFDAYYASAKSAIAIYIRNPRSLDRPITLRELRMRIAGFHPPQTFRYLPDFAVESLGLSGS